MVLSSDRSDFKAGRNYCAAQGYNSRMENPIQLRPRFIEAVDYARHVHVELRKGTQVPYMAHFWVSRHSCLARPATFVLTW